MATCCHCHAPLTAQQFESGNCPACRGALVASGKSSDDDRDTVDIADGVAKSAPQDSAAPAEQSAGETLGSTGLYTVDYSQGTRATVANFGKTHDLIGIVPSTRQGAADAPTSSGGADDGVRTVWAGAVQSDATPMTSLRASHAAALSATPPRPGKRTLASKGRAEIEQADYQLDGFVADGGMGRVYLAQQTALQRTVALKELKPAFAKDENRRAKFLTEAAVTGDLEHPNIVPIYDLGVDQDGNFFYSMKRVTGKAWQDIIAKQSRHENLAILMRVADAVAYAHSRQVIHRDVKPENVMLGGFGEVLLMDWGLAVRLDVDAQIPAAGTPAYMAPEMAAGVEHLIGVRTDVYLLGANLYQIIEGEPPHQASDVYDCIRAARENEIARPERPDELFMIAQRAMATDPKDRYSSVMAFQDAIRTYLEHAESIELAKRADEDLREAKETGDLEIYSRAQLGFKEALDLWATNESAGEGLQQTKIAYATDAYERGNYDLGLSLIDPSNPRERGLWHLLDKAAHSQAQKDQRRKFMRMAATLFIIGTIAALTWSYLELKTENLELEHRLIHLEQRNASLDEPRELGSTAARPSEE